jgi:hypothetical protein
MSATVPELHRSHVLPDCGHWIGEERPRETNSALLDFIAQVAPVARATSLAA